MPATTYEFFVSNGAPKPATRAIRSHAMRTALQQRRSAGVAAASSTVMQPPQGSAAESQRTEQHKHDLKGRFRLATSARRNGNKHSATDKQATSRMSGTASRKLKRYRIAGKAPTLSELYALEGRGDLEDRDAEFIQMLTSDGASEIEWLGSDRADPFGVMPVEANWRVDMLVKYFLTRFNLNITTVDKERPWFSFAMSTPLIMRVTLALSAAFWGAATCQASPIIKREGIYQKGEAIKTINHMLQQDTVADELIAGVANLGNIAAIEGLFDEADVHARGLRRLTDLRGGAMVFKDTYYLARALNWMDVQVASAKARKPLYPLIHGLEDVNLPDSLIDESQTPLLAHLDEWGDHGMVIGSTLRLLRQVVLCRKYRVSAPQGIRILMNVAEFQILDHIQDEVATAEDHRFKTLLFATHVFLYAGLRQLPPMGPMIRLLVSRLRESLEAGAVNVEAWRDHLADFVWVLFVGAAASHMGALKEANYANDYKKRTSWFRARLELAVRLLGIETEAELEEVLHRYVWADEFGRDFIGKFWTEVGEVGQGEAASQERVAELLADVGDEMERELCDECA